MISQTSSRFERPSSSFVSRDLLKRGGSALWVCSILAMALHVGFSVVGRIEAEAKSAKPLTTQFIKRQPRLSKPLELKKRPHPKRRRIQRKMISVRAKASRRDVSKRIRPVEVVGSLSKPQVVADRAPRWVTQGTDARTLAASISSTREVEGAVSMAVEMLDIGALDTGQYHAMVVQDPQDKRRISGFFHLAIAYSVNAAHASLGAHYYENPMALPNLVAAINKYTDIETDITASFPFASGQLFLTPWVYCPVSSYAGTPFALTYEEARNLGKYMLTGGFFFADDSNPRRGDNPDRVARAMIRDAFRGVEMKQGNDWNFERLPIGHPIYHCYFDFPNGPPPGLDSPGLRGPGHGPYDYIEGIVINDRVVALMSNKAFDEAWSLHQGRAAWSTTYDNTRALQFGINTVVFALTQEGSITNRVMDAVR